MVLANVSSDVERTDAVNPERALPATPSARPSSAAEGGPVLRIEETHAIDERRDGRTARREQWARRDLRRARRRGARDLLAGGMPRAGALAHRVAQPEIHSPDRRKIWVACDEHRDFLRDYLAAREFPVAVAPLTPLAPAAPTGDAS